MKRMLLTLMAVCLICLPLSACTNKNNSTLQTNPSATMQTNDTANNLELLPEGTDNMMPDVSMSPTFTDPYANGVTTADSARRVAEQIEDELERLSEVTDAQVIAIGNMAAVALRFDAQYRAGVDERLQTMVKERIKSVVNGIDNVYITADTAHLDTLRTLGDRLDKATDLIDIQAELTRLIADMNPTV